MGVPPAADPRPRNKQGAVSLLPATRAAQNARNGGHSSTPDSGLRPRRRGWCEKLIIFSPFPHFPCFPCLFSSDEGSLERIRSQGRRRLDPPPPASAARRSPLAPSRSPRSPPVRFRFKRAGTHCNFRSVALGSALPYHGEPDASRGCSTDCCSPSPIQAGSPAIVASASKEQPNLLARCACLGTWTVAGCRQSSRTGS